jgi:uncharacterized membrane protein
MLRDAVAAQVSASNKEFRYRGIEPGRLENFSDACFALAITLLLISTSPPSSFIQVKKFVWEIIPFGLCITLVLMIWHQHFIFFYRYGLRDTKVLVMNGLFLVIVLFYVYPLKFLTRAILLPLTAIFDAEDFHLELRQIYGGGSMDELMIIYGLGAAAVFLVMALLYRYALNKAEQLGLSEIEKFDTKTSMQANVLMASIPLISVIIAMSIQSPNWSGLLSGLSYFLYSPAMTIFWRRKVKARNRLLAIQPVDASNDIEESVQ